MTFQIGDSVKLTGGKWFNEAGADLSGGEFVIVADNPTSEYFIDDIAMTVEILAISSYPTDFQLIAKPKPTPVFYRVGDRVELMERYDHQSKGDQGVVTSIEKSYGPADTQMLYVDFGSGGRGRPIGMYNYRVKPVASGPAALLGILQMIETTSKRVGTGDTQAILFSLMEEVGELATEINIENGTKDREPSEDGVEGEAIDVLVVIGDLLTSLFGSLESAELRTKVAAKLAKWERNAQ